jgi:hypothetical protein
MSAFATLNVSRKAAMAKLAEGVFGHMTDDDLQRVLDYRFEGALRNFRVGYSDCDDEELERL